MQNTPKLSIIIVSWNTSQLTLKCIKSLYERLQGLNFEVFVVDNNSPDNTVEQLQKYKQENNLASLNILAEKTNHGFAKGNNIAIKKATGEYILLLNPDTEIIDNSILKMINFAESNKEIGIVGPKLLNSDKTLQRSCRQFPKLSDQIFIQLKFYNFFADKIKSIREYFMLDFAHDESREVDQVMGAAMLIKKEVFDKIGLLDEKFWAVFEEVDFCYRALQAGYKIYFYPNCQIIHHKEQSFSQMKQVAKQINYNHSLYRYFKKHKPFHQLLALWFFQPINLLLVWLDSKLGIRKHQGKSKDL